MGDDDRLKPCCLDEYVRLINKYPTLNLYHAWTELIDDRGDVIKVLPHRPRHQGCMEMIWNHWNGDTQYIGDFCFKTEYLRSNGGFFKQPLAWASDDITTARAAFPYGIANTQKVGFQYRENSLTISKSGYSAIKIEAKIKEKEWFRQFINDIEQCILQSSDDEEKQYFGKVKIGFEEHYKQQVFQYLKEYFQESLLNIIPALKQRKHYGLRRIEILKMFLKVANYVYLKK